MSRPQRPSPMMLELLEAVAAHSIDAARKDDLFWRCCESYKSMTHAQQVEFCDLVQRHLTVKASVVSAQFGDRAADLHSLLIELRRQSQGAK